MSEDIRPTNKEYGPADMIMNNIKTFLGQAQSHRQDAERSMKKADDCERRTVEWREAWEKLNA